ncbi:MAG TPA: hypothetical protein VE046_07905 [Steroidobacteraceae bacterium]|nr:hypothetical protein [Steroidobacteraceae bacterium]
MKIRTLLALPLLLTLGSLKAQADSTARIVELQPSATAALGRGESLYVRIEYATDEPISLWARPFRRGAEVKTAMSNASMSHTGSGEALGWFALTEPGEVDEIRIRAGGGKPYREWDLARQPVQLTWTTAAPAAAARPAWVDQLAATEQAEMRDQMQRQASQPVSAGSAAFFSGFMLLVIALLIAGIAVPMWSVWKWRGGWRLAAAVPAALIGFVLLRIIVDTSRDPTSHNLWPFEILQFGTLALIAIGIMKFIRRRLGAEATPP